VKEGIIELDSMTKIFKIKRNAIERILDFLVQKEELMGDRKG
jgi:hypothetical protein